MIAGPTAVGKTSISLLVAHDLGGEIISADSRQVFRQMHIGTASPEVSEKGSVPHHFIAEKNLDEPFSAGIFAKDAESRIAEVIERGARPVVVGGSTLYLRALTQGLADIPDIDPSVRKALNSRLVNEGAEVLFKELTELDPEFSNTLDHTKTQRIVRGLEVWIGTGVRLSEHFKNARPPSYKYQYYILDRDRLELYERINRRVTAMMEAGLAEEVESILSAGTDPATNALQTIGYREVIRHLSGEVSIDLTISDVQRNTRRYAKRQLTWFRKIPDAIWVNLAGRSDRTVADDLLSKIRTLDRPC